MRQEFQISDIRQDEKGLLHELIEMIHFVESVSTKIHGVFDEAEIYSIVGQEFQKSKKYTASILLLTSDES